MNLLDSTKKLVATRGYQSSTLCGGETIKNVEKMVYERFPVIFKEAFNRNPFNMQRFEISYSGGYLTIQYTTTKNQVRKVVARFQQMPAQCGMGLVNLVTVENLQKNFLHFALYFIREMAFRNGFASCTILTPPLDIPIEPKYFQMIKNTGSGLLLYSHLYEYHPTSVGFNSFFEEYK